MGVEPTVACSAQPTTGFEDRAHHRARTTPAITCNLTIPNRFVQPKSGFFPLRARLRDS
jgi:hypothetical protein